MDDAVLAQLRTALATHAPLVYQDAWLTLSILRDLSGPDRYRREISLLASAVREDIPNTLLHAQETAPPLPPTLGDRLARKLQDNQAIDGEAARWAVRTWASAFHITGLRFSTPSARRLSTPSARLVNEAMEIAASIPVEKAKAVALGMVATALAATDPNRAARLLDEAELILQSVTDEAERTRQGHDLSVTLAASHPQRAEFQALSIQGLLRDDALGYLASIMAWADPDRALRLAWSIEHGNLRMHALDGLATTMADAEPDRAERLAWSLAGEYWKTEALCHVATALVIQDPERAAGLLGNADTLSRSIADEPARAAALSSVARTLVGLDPGRAARLFDEAERLALSITDEAARAPALGSLAIALAASDPDRAEALARSLPDNWYPLGEIARTLAVAWPDRALRLAQSITNQTPQLADVAVAVVAADPDDALYLAWTIKAERLKVTALVGIARVLAATARDRAGRLLDDAERFARQMTDDFDKVTALVDLAAVWQENW